MIPHPWLAGALITRAGVAVTNYIKAEASVIIDGPLAPEAVALRLAQCRACPALRPAETAEMVGYCSACGCPDWRRSALAVKATMPAAKCPLLRWA